MRIATCLCVVALFLAGMTRAADDGFVELFPDEASLKDWTVARWNDVSQAPEQEVRWKVENGVLTSGEPRGTWLMSKKEYGDFVLEFEFKLSERGNSGLALRAPLKGDPAFDGMELQMADYRYNTEAKESELTGGIYRAIAPKKQVYKPTEWNKYQVTLDGSFLKVVLNDTLIHDLDLEDQEQEVKRHDGSIAPRVRDRPRKGHIGFQELSRDGNVQIRGARIKVLRE